MQRYRCQYLTCAIWSSIWTTFIALHFFLFLVMHFFTASRDLMNILLITKLYCVLKYVLKLRAFNPYSFDHFLTRRSIIHGENRFSIQNIPLSSLVLQKCIRKQLDNENKYWNILWIIESEAVIMGQKGTNLHFVI